MRAHRWIATTATVGLAFLALLSTGPHTVRPGETLALIASANDTTVAALVRANALSNPDRIYAGQRLTIPATAASTMAYTVRSGDTLGTVAGRHGTTVASLVALNTLANPNLIRIGQVLQVPASGGTGGGSTTTPADGATTHVVRAGETISGIAQRHGIPQAQLIAANGLTDGRVYVGQQLRLVPVAGTAPTSATSYTVRAGDTLSSIAQRFGTTVRALQSANGLTDPNHVVVGSTLKVPAGGTGGGGAIVCPVQGAITFMNDWGFPRSGGRFHEGNDLFAPRGRPAVATVAGTVLQTTGRIGGNQVKLLGDDGVSYYYTHLDRFGTGGRVAAGTVIGYVGNTGNAAGSAPHVHFEVHPGGGAAVNPYPRLAPVC